MQYVGVGMRLVAAIIDVVVFFVLAWLVAMLTGSTTEDGFALNGGTALLPVVVWFIYVIGMEATVGATLGKMALGLRVVKTDGTSPIGWPASLIRNLLRIVDGLFVYLVGAILVWRSPTRQRLGDRVAGTVVIKKSSLTSAAPAPAAV